MAISGLLFFFFLFIASAVVYLGIPAALLLGGYFALKGYKKRKDVSHEGKPEVFKQGNIKP